MTFLAILLPFLFLSVTNGANPIFVDNSPFLAEPSPRIDYRLPINVEPKRYELTLQPEFTTFTFTGTAKISISVKSLTRDITLHAKNLTINKVTLETTTSNKTENVPLRSPAFELMPEKDFLIIKADSDLKIGDYALTIEYKGVLNDNLQGFYKSHYTNAQNKQRWLATTQFEPTHARLAFPCWDEPHFKAIFKITLKHPSDYPTAISNAPLQSKKEEPKGTMTSVFEDTVGMSTYLVAFIVSDYEMKQDGDKFRVWTKPQAINDTAYALKVGKQALDELSKFTGINYYDHMKKMDQISIPHFAAGAMENWGLVTYRESGLLYNEKTTSTSAKQGIATVIAHEFAHQWFGNLVSPLWWKYIWLNEGFANYFQYYIANLVEKDWRLMEQLVVDTMQGRAFITDASEKSRPMNHDAQDPKSIKALFDNIAYQKSGSVIRMMSHVLTEKVFQKGLQIYLNRHQKKIATSDDLFKAFQDAVNEVNVPSKGFDVSKYFSNWVNQAGYPVVHVTTSADGKKVELRQEQYSLQYSAETNVWYVPINYITAKTINFNETLATNWIEPGKNLTIELKDADKDTWIIVNKLQTGYYRVNYDERNWQLLVKYLASKDFKNIEPVNRAQLIDDAFQLALIGKLKYTTALDLLKYLKQESDYIPWVPAYRSIEFLNRMLVKSKEYNQFKLLIGQLLENVIKTVGLEPKNDKDTHLNKLARPNIVRWGSTVGQKDCVTYVQKKLNDYLAEPSKIDLGPDLKGSILCGAIRTAKEDQWNKLLKKYTDIKDEAEQRIILAALGCTGSKEILEGYVERIFNETIPRKDLDTAFSSVIGNANNGIDVGLVALAENMDVIREMGDDKLKRYLDELGRRITTKDHHTELGLLIAKQGIAPEISNDAIQNVPKNLLWMEENEAVVNEWLKNLVFTKPDDKGNNGANSVTVATFVLVIPLLITRFY